METTNYNDELYRNNLELAVKLKERFIQFRNMLIYFIACAVGYSFGGTLIKNGWIMFASLAVMYAVVSLAMKIVDEMRYSIRVHNDNRKRARNKKKKLKVKTLN